MRFVTAGLAYGVAGRSAARGPSAKVPDPPLDWTLVKGPWFDNNLATLEVEPTTGSGCGGPRADVEGDAHHRPRLVTVSDVTIESRAADVASLGSPG